VRPDPSIVARLLRLPLEARRRLAEQGGDGRWVETGYVSPLVDSPGPIEPRLARGAAWFPSDSAAWMLATGCPDWSIDCDSGEVVAVIIDQSSPMKDWHRGTTAEECALSWFEAGPRLAPDP